MNELFEGSDRKIVFWYDDDAAYEGDIDSLQLSEGIKVFKLTGSNNFEAKLLLEHRDVDSNYLVYAPYARPEDKENSLVDIFYYSEHFYSDKLIQLMGGLNIPQECQAFFVDADGAKISFPVPITANIKSADAKDRLIQEKFTLKSGRYSRDQEYFLVIADQDDEKKELHRYKFEIDISDILNL